MSVSVPDALAEWAYSEIVEGVSSRDYEPLVPDELRRKRRLALPFSRLSQSDRYCLARACWKVRPLILIHLIGITRFELANINKAELANILVPPTAAIELRGNYATFELYMAIPSDDQKDARNILPSQNWSPPDAPLTLGYHFQHRVLIDGFHRAAAFWRSSTGGGLKAYVPQDAPYATSELQFKSKSYS
jgi:hypothetical protein